MNISNKSKGYVYYLLITFVLVLNWLSACKMPERNSEAINKPHPVFHKFYLDESECKKIKPNQCIIVGVDLHSIKFHVSTEQCYTPPKDNQEPKEDPKDTENYVEQLQQINEPFHWFITPSNYGVWSYTLQKANALNIKTPIKHNFKQKNTLQKQGITLEVINELYHIDPNITTYSSKDIIIVIGTGINGKLGISDEAKTELQKWKKNNKIDDYIIEQSGEAAEKHNSYVKKNKKVFTLIPLCC